MKTFTTVYLMVSLFVSLIALNVAQALEAPEQVVKQTVNTIVTNIQKNRSEYKSDNQKLYEMVESVLVPAVHVERMSQLILAKNWRKATDAQRQDFVAQFQTFLMRSYATALLEYSGEKVNYKEPIPKGNDRVVVKAELVSNAGEIYPVNLYMSNRKDTRWRAYNIEVAGINFVSSYRSTFGDIVAQKGIDGLLSELKQKNAKLGV